MALVTPSPAPSRFVTLATIVVVVAVLRIAEEVTIPLALALLLAFLLSPLVVRLTRWMPKALAIAATVTVAFSIVGVAAWQITSQAMALMQELPRYEQNLHQKITALKQPEKAGSFSQALRTLEKMEADLLKPAAEPAAPPADGKHAPVPVEVKATNRDSFAVARDIASGFVRPLGTAGIVIVFVIAILFQRDDLRNRFIRVISGGQLNIATQAVDDAAQRVSRYLVAQLLVNTCFGICIGAGLAFIGVPHAALWGLLATLLRFIPFLGPLIAATFPLLLGVAVDPGWSMLLWTAGLFIVIEIITNNLVEIWVYGTSTGISTLALLTAAVFWSWLWGLPGLFLSTPLTVCLLVLGQYVPGLKFLGVLLGSEPPLDPAAQFYQRMLSMQQEDLFNAAETYVEQHSLAAFYDDVFMPALLMAEVDRHNGVLAEVRQKFIFESGADLIEELSQRTRSTDGAQRVDEIGPPLPEHAGQRAIIGLPARDEADELVAQMLAHLLRENGVAVEVVPVTAPPESHLPQLKAQNATVFVSALPPSTLSGAGRTCRRVKQANPSAKVLVGVWGTDAKVQSLRSRLDPAGADGIATRLADAVAQLKALLVAGDGANAPAAETRTTRTLERTEVKLSASKPEEATETVIRELARAFEVPSALVSVLETDGAFWRSPSNSASTPPFGEASVYGEVLASDTLLVVEDVGKDERFSSQPSLQKRGVKFFASAPLRTHSGHLIGNLCVLDTRPRAFSESDRELLQSLAAQLMETLDAKAPPSAAAAPVG